jgi:hypothetical protein
MKKRRNPEKQETKLTPEEEKEYRAIEEARLAFNYKVQKRMEKEKAGSGGGWLMLVGIVGIFIAWLVFSRK